MNVWQAIFGFIGNYFWTHYFFNLLGAAYTLPSHKLNGVRAVEWQGCTCWVCVTPNQPASITAWCPLWLLDCVAAGCTDTPCVCFARLVWCGAGAAGDVPHDTRVLLLLPRHIKPGPAQGRDQQHRLPHAAAAHMPTAANECLASACCNATFKTDRAGEEVLLSRAGLLCRSSHTCRTRPWVCVSWREVWPCSCWPTAPPTWRPSPSHM